MNKDFTLRCNLPRTTGIDFAALFEKIPCDLRLTDNLCVHLASINTRREPQVYGNIPMIGVHPNQKQNICPGDMQRADQCRLFPIII